MEIYIAIMTTLSLFGILTLIFSMYIFIAVPSKLSCLIRVALIANSITNCSFQIYLSLGLIPTFLLPCFAFYTNGLMKYAGVNMFVQMFILVNLYGLSGWFVVLLSLLRAVAITIHLSERRKTLIISVFFTYSIIHLILFTWFFNDAVAATSEKSRISCVKKFKDSLSSEALSVLMSERMVLSIDTENYQIVYVTITTILLFTLIGFVCTVYLAWSLRSHINQTIASKAAETQRKLTCDILKLGLFQAVGISVPPLIGLFSILSSISSKTLTDVLAVLLSMTPNIACIIMLRLVPAYKERLNEICSSVLPVELIKRITKPIPRKISVQSSVVQSTSSS